MNTITNAANSASASALSGMAAAQKRLDVVANNIANRATEGFQASIVTQQAQPSGGVRTVVTRRPDSGEGYVEDRVEQIQALYDFKANVKSLQAADDALGSLLDIRS